MIVLCSRRIIYLFMTSLFNCLKKVTSTLGCSQSNYRWSHHCCNSMVKYLVSDFGSINQFSSAKYWLGNFLFYWTFKWHKIRFLYLRWSNKKNSVYFSHQKSIKKSTHSLPLSFAKRVYFHFSTVFDCTNCDGGLLGSNELSVCLWELSQKISA